MIAIVSWLASVAKSVGSWLERKSEDMKSKRVKDLVAMESLTSRQAKELERLVKNLPEVTVIGEK